MYADAVPIQLAFPGKRPETGWPDRVSIMLGSLLPQAVGENDENRRRKVAIAFFSDEKRLQELTNSATRGREIRAAEIVIRPAPGLPAQTGLRNDRCATRLQYQIPITGQSRLQYLQYELVHCILNADKIGPQLWFECDRKPTNRFKFASLML